MSRKNAAQSARVYVCLATVLCISHVASLTLQQGHDSFAQSISLPDAPELLWPSDEPYTPDYDKLRHLANKVVYLRIPKTGSTSIELMMRNAGCPNLSLQFHEVFARDLPAETKNFVVLREVTDRFVSQWAHLNYTLSQCKDSGIINPNILDGPLFTPVSWGKALLENHTLRSALLVREPTNSQAKCQHAVLAWRQIEYVNEFTRFACLPSMKQDVQSILDQESLQHSGGGRCTLPEEVHENSGQATRYDPRIGDAHSWNEHPEVQALARTLYSLDYKLWKTHCE